MDKNLLRNFEKDLEDITNEKETLKSILASTKEKYTHLIMDQYHSLVSNLKEFTDLIGKYNCGHTYNYKVYESNGYEFLVSYHIYPEEFLINVNRVEADTIGETFYGDEAFIDLEEFNPKFTDAFIHFLKNEDVVIRNLMTEIIKRNEKIQHEKKCKLYDKMIAYYSVIHELEAENISEENENGFYGDVYIYVPEAKQLLRISEGIGTNLLDEDKANGYVDYVYYEQFNLDPEMTNCDGSQIMLKEMFKDKYKSTFKAIPDVLDMAYGNRNLKYTVLR